MADTSDGSQFGLSGHVCCKKFGYMCFKSSAVLYQTMAEKDRILIEDEKKCPQCNSPMIPIPFHFSWGMKYYVCSTSPIYELKDGEYILKNNKSGG